MRKLSPSAVLLSSLCLCASVVSSASVRAAEKLEYNRDVRPILAENCFACHGPDSASRKGDLRLDRSDDAIKAKAYVPGKPDDSELVERINSDMSSRLMPPPKSGKKLTAAQKATLTRWIAEGAEYQAHWSFIAPKRPAPPAVNPDAGPPSAAPNATVASSWCRCRRADGRLAANDTRPGSQAKEQASGPAGAMKRTTLAGM